MSMAAAAIRQALIDLAGQGAALVIISQDLDELFEISDRLAVINHGRLSQAKPVHATTREEIGLLMAANTPVYAGSDQGGGVHAH